MSDEEGRGNGRERRDGEPGSDYWGDVRRSQQQVMTVRAQEARRDSGTGRTITRIGATLASPWFFGGLLLAHLGWVVLNLGVLPGVRPWDPYPFTFLATIASVEAPFLALLILMRQLRDARVAELREETELQVSFHAERQSSMLMRLVDDIHRTVVDRGRDTGREERRHIEEMKEPLDPERLLAALEHEVGEEEPSGAAEGEPSGGSEEDASVPEEARSDVPGEGRR